ncbi:TIGR03986 family type III CRISPR-associated RAMP protein [Falsiroseomonas sp.]|uniref:TIGR03986 family type III CRISPR-associated RAMP protein n=1 Tax=Falsiroseomonas sp. TaxID=2870721 RepID=UPI003F726952
MPIVADYNFVPLSDFIWQPSWGNAVSHDQPFQDGLCGEIEVVITARSPLLVGGGDEARTAEGSHTKVHFCRVPTPKGETFAIPGSSLRGMLRAVTEIASFGRMSLIEDRQLGVRDLTTGVKFYVDRMNGTTRSGDHSPNARGGWLTLGAGGEMWIQSCRFARVEHGKLTPYFAACRPGGEAAGLDFWQKAADTQSFRQRFDAVAGFTSVSFMAPIDRQPVGHAKALRRDVLTIGPRGNMPSGCDEGFVVVTGGMPKKKNKETGLPEPTKKREFVFFDEVGARLRVPPGVVRAFEDIHDHGSMRTEHADSPWMVWKQRWREGLCGPTAHAADPAREPGIPVFFLADRENRVLALGLAMMFKLPYDQTIGQVVANTAPEHRNPDGGYDMAELLFGALRPTPERCLRGRVSVGMALPNGAAVRPTEAGPYVLGSPKPSYYPNYIRQPTDPQSADERLLPKNGYATYMKPMRVGQAMPEIRGWKRYHARTLPAVPSADAQAQQATARSRRAIGSSLETVPTGTTFTATLRLHNLRLAEIGALLWALRFGDRDLFTVDSGRWRHALGMGRARGFGQVTLHVQALRLRPNDPAMRTVRWRAGGMGQQPAKQVLDRAIAAFEEAVSIAHRAAAPGRAGWDVSEQITALRALADPRMAPAGPRMVLAVGGKNAFAEAKKNRDVLKPAAPRQAGGAGVQPRPVATATDCASLPAPPENAQA